MRAAASRTFCTAGSRRPMRMAMIAITTSSSISVKAGERCRARMGQRNMDAMTSKNRPKNGPGCQHVKCWNRGGEATSAAVSFGYNARKGKWTPQGHGRDMAVNLPCASPGLRVRDGELLLQYPSFEKWTVPAD